MSTITAPPPSLPALDRPQTVAVTDVAARRTLIGFVATRRVVEIILTVVLGVGGGLLLFGSNFGLNMVHTRKPSPDGGSTRRNAIGHFDPRPISER